MQLAFGAGALWGNRTDVTGSGIGPDQFGIPQDVQIDWDWQTKELWGQFQFPVDIARGQGKITGKAKFARIFGAIYGDLFFGQTPTAGQLTVSENEAATVPATSSYTVTGRAVFGQSDDRHLHLLGRRCERRAADQLPLQSQCQRQVAGTDQPVH